MRARSPSSAKGFALVVVVVLLVAISGLAVILYNGASQSVFASARARHTPAARAIAETCADRAAAYSREIIAAGASDFDDVLSPPVGDKYLPPGGTTVQVPSGTVDDEHKYSFLRIGNGACLVRFDDNSDEMKTVVGLTDDPDEGPVNLVDGAENLAKDRDQAIYVTSIGLHPVGAAVLPGAAFNTAPEKVTIRRFVGGSSAPAIWVGDQLTTGNNQTFCGEGGIQAEGQTGIGGGDCVCGVFGVPGGGTPSNCGAACPGTCAPTPPNAAAAPVANPPVPPDTGFLANELWGAPNSSNNRIGDRLVAGPVDDIWAVYFRDGGAGNPNAAIGGTYGLPGAPYSGLRPSYQPAAGTEVFAWDSTETVPMLSGARAITCVQNAAPATNTAALCNGPPWNIPVAAGDPFCANYARDPVERPCNWSVSAATVVCAEGETPCWKPIGMIGVPYPHTDVGAGVVQTAGNDFVPVDTAPLPFFEDTTRNWGDVDAPCTACGAPVFQRGVTWGMPDTCGDEVPEPMLALFETTANIDITGKVGKGCAGNETVHLAFSASRLAGTVDMTTGNEFEVYGPACTPQPNAAGACTVAALQTPPTKDDCTVININGLATFSNNSFLVGEIEAGSINAKNAFCAAGNLTATSAAGDCGAGNGAIQIDNSATLLGFIQSAGDVCIKNNSTVVGQIFAQDDVQLDNNNTITNPGGGIGGGTQAVAWMETTW